MSLNHYVKIFSISENRTMSKPNNSNIKPSIIGEVTSNYKFVILLTVSNT